MNAKYTLAGLGLTMCLDVAADAHDSLMSRIAAQLDQPAA